MPLCRSARFLVGFFALSSMLASACYASPRDKEAVHAQAHYMMGLFYEHQNKLDDAIAEYQEALRLEKDIPSIHLRLASVFIRKSDTAKAIEALEEAKRLDPEGLEAGLMLALLYSTQDSSDKASKEYEEVLKRASRHEPKNVYILKSLAALYYQQKKFENAIETYRLILTLSDDDYEALFLMGSLLEETGKRKEAVEKFKETLTLNPEYPDALNSLGYVYAEEGANLAEAEELVKKALAADPDNGAYLDSLGWVYFKMSDVDKAIEYLEKAGSALSDPVIFDHLGDAYFKKGAPEKASENWEKSLRLDAQQEKVKEKLKKLTQ